MHKAPSAEWSYSNFSLSPNSLKVIFMYTIINYFSTSDFKFLRIETRSYFISKISLLFTLLNGKRDNKFKVSPVFQYYQLNFLQSKLKTCALANSYLNHCRNGLPIEWNTPCCRPRVSAFCQVAVSCRTMPAALAQPTVCWLLVYSML